MAGWLAGSRSWFPGCLAGRADWLSAWLVKLLVSCWRFVACYCCCSCLALATGRLAGWLANYLAGWLAGCVAGWLPGQTGWLAGWLQAAWLAVGGFVTATGWLLLAVGGLPLLIIISHRYWLAVVLFPFAPCCCSCHA